MTPRALTRRGLVLAGAATLAGCGGTGEDLEIRLPAQSPLGQSSELLAMRRLLVAERLQKARYEHLVGLLPSGARKDRGLLEREAEIEGRHVDAIADLVRALGGRPDPWEPTSAPDSAPAALRELIEIERAVAGAWQDSARTFTGLETRTAAFSLLGCELRQVSLLQLMSGGGLGLVTPRALTVSALMTSLRAAIGEVPGP